MSKAVVRMTFFIDGHIVAQIADRCSQIVVDKSPYHSQSQDRVGYWRADQGHQNVEGKLGGAGGNRTHAAHCVAVTY